MNQEIKFMKDYVLPSNGLFYSEHTNVITLEGLDQNEISGLNQKDYKELSRIIDRHFVTKINVSSYDMAINDFFFLLIKIRTLTYGYNINLGSICPHCRKINNYELNMSGLDTVYLSKDIVDNLLNIKLQKSGYNLKLKPTTVRMINEIGVDNYNEYLKCHIDLDDKEEINNIVESLGLIDKRIISKQIEKIDNSFGIKKEYKVVCGSCKNEYKSFFELNNDFFNPKDEY